MSIFGTRTARAAVVALAAGSLALTGCSGNSKDKSGTTGGVNQDEAAKQGAAVSFGDAKVSTGPAAEVPGAKPGGTIAIYQTDDFSHLDPAQSYVSDARLLGRLIHRGLTQYQEGEGGKLTVVGDIATDSGTTTDGGKTWKYTLKDGVKDANGNVITSADVRHTVERLYAPFVTDGPVYLQNWLSGEGTTYRKALPDGPYKGKHLPDTVLETPDAKTVIFKFKEPQADLPQALAMTGYSIVPAKGDTKEKYDTAPVALGPYKIAEFKPGKSMKLVKNTNWDPKTDSVRHQYVDGFNITFNQDDEAQTKTILADRGEGKNMIQLTGTVATTQVRNVLSDPAAKKRTIQGYQPYVWQLNFNLDRMKDKKVRDAIAIAMPSANIYQPDGGAYGGEIATGLIAPTLPGFEKNYDPFEKKKYPNGNIEKAKKMIEEAGAKGKKVVYAYANTPKRQQQAVVIANALTKIGLDVQKKEIDGATWYEQVGKVNNGLDLYMTGWGQDWASASTVIPPLYDGNQLQDGSSVYSHINDPKVNADIAKAKKITDPAEAQKAWTALHHDIVERINPAAPLYFTKSLQIQGSNVGGARYSTDLSAIDVTRVFLKS
ncbi:ABC transporter substrate-binding protein [Streptomyces sp. TRM76323]|uniref:ABC transporter substrate-binding protein n=1 Tax=Streptomyces tamarix TaxID=3078565 RepID=A0ABU3QSD4_9ACTN|nr:ABC transporter substrate-binding protein [Streptomyces tamarix]MDT9685675.1 ABC transporter substrate-binding protein [Streptomyces tamarix]